MKGKLGRGGALSRSAKYLLVGFLAVFFLMPLYWMVIGSFREMVGAMATPELFPDDLTLKNYHDLFQSSYPVWRWLLNSVLISTLTTFFSVLVCCMMGYAFGKWRFPGRDFLFLLVAVTMMLPKQAMLIPLFLTTKRLDLIDSLWGVILPSISWPYGIFMMRQFMSDVPDELIECARMEGAGEPRIFMQIVLPLLKPAISTLAIIMFMQSWGDFMWQLIILKDRTNWTMNVGLSVLFTNASGGANIVNYGLAMAGGVIGAIPVVAFFICFQKYFIKGVALGAVKG